MSADLRFQFNENTRLADCKGKQLGLGRSHSLVFQSNVQVMEFEAIGKSRRRKARG